MVHNRSLAKSLSNVIVTMASLKTTPGKASLKLDDIAQGDVTGIIGMVGSKTKGLLARKSHSRYHITLIG